MENILLKRNKKTAPPGQCSFKDALLIIPVAGNGRRYTPQYCIPTFFPA
jgi:hypothetical protein